MEHSAANRRLWHRSAGLCAFGLFCSGLLLAAGLGRVVLIVAALGVFGVLALLSAWLLFRQRASVASSLATGCRVAAPVAVRLTKAAQTLAERLALTAKRTTHRSSSWARKSGRRARPLASHLRRRAVAAAAEGGPAVRAAQEALWQVLRAMVKAIADNGSRVAALFASDIATYRRGASNVRRRQLPPSSRFVGWDAAYEEDALRTKDEIEPTAARERVSAAS